MSRSTMRRCMQAGLAMLACLPALAVSAPPVAAVENPADWVQKVYAGYAADVIKVSALDLFKPEASERLKKLIAAEEACIKRRKGAPCKLDFDPVVGGQDFEIKNVSVAPGPSAQGRIAVIATFDNFGKAQVIEYSFVQAAKGWQLDDLSFKTPGESGWVLSKLLGGKN